MVDRERVCRALDPLSQRLQQLVGARRRRSRFLEDAAREELQKAGLAAALESCSAVIKRRDYRSSGIKPRSTCGFEGSDGPDLPRRRMALIGRRSDTRVGHRSRGLGCASVNNDRRGDDPAAATRSARHCVPAALQGLWTRRARQLRRCTSSGSRAFRSCTASL